MVVCNNRSDIWISTADGETHYGMKFKFINTDQLIDTTKPHMKAAFDGVITFYSEANNRICSFDPKADKWYYDNKAISLDALCDKLQMKQYGSGVMDLIRRKPALTEVHEKLQYEHKNSDGKVVYSGQRPIKGIDRPLYGTKFVDNTNVKGSWTGYFAGNDPENLIRLNYDKAPATKKEKDPQDLLIELTQQITELQDLLSNNKYLTEETIKQLLNNRMQDYKILSRAHKISQNEALVGPTNKRFNNAFWKVKNDGKAVRKTTEKIIPMNIIKEQITSANARYKKLKEKLKEPQERSYGGGKIKLGKLPAQANRGFGM